MDGPIAQALNAPMLKRAMRVYTDQGADVFTVWHATLPDDEREHLHGEINAAVLALTPTVKAIIGMLNVVVEPFKKILDAIPAEVYEEIGRAQRNDSTGE